jgi:hypothetical protein
MVAYEKQTVAILRETAVERKLNKRVVHFWKLNKADLIDLLRNPPSSSSTASSRASSPPPSSRVDKLCLDFQDCKIASKQRKAVDNMGIRTQKKK